jgi:hypothetical protein
LALRFSALPAQTTKVRQTTLHSITDIMAPVVVADVMDMDKAECSISRILPVRNLRCRANNNDAFEQISTPILQSTESARVFLSTSSNSTAVIFETRALPRLPAVTLEASPLYRSSHSLY